VVSLLSGFGRRARSFAVGPFRSRDPQPSGDAAAEGPRRSSAAAEEKADAEASTGTLQARRRTPAAVERLGALLKSAKKAEKVASLAGLMKAAAAPGGKENR
jgi:hypothetical protein